jgi:hypothetical protein
LPVGPGLKLAVTNAASMLAAKIKEVPTMASKRGNRHALRHGLYAREAVLPWEEEEAFAALHRSFVDELNPDGPLENEVVREVAELHWRKQRLALGYLLPFYREMPPPELADAAKDGLIALASYLADTAHRSPGTIVATHSQILDFIKGRKGDANSAVNQPNASAILQSPDTSPRNIVELAYDPATIEQRLKIETAIDNRIAKIMARLVGLKEYKRMYGQKPVLELPTSAPPLVPVEQPSKPVCPTPQAAPTPTNQRKWGDPD